MSTRNISQPIDITSLFGNFLSAPFSRSIALKTIAYVTVIREEQILNIGRYTSCAYQKNSHMKLFHVLQSVQKK